MLTITKMEVAGTLFRVFNPQQISDKFKKREFVIEVNNGKYPQYVKLQLNNEKCDLIEGYNEGDSLNVSFDLQGRQFTDRNGNEGFITNIVAWKIETA